MQTERIFGGRAGRFARRWQSGVAIEGLPSEEYFIGEERQAPLQRRARGLGWFSLGLGLAQLAAPAVLARLVLGTDDRRKRTTMRAVGLRELAVGVGLLARARPVGWLWTRVVGDVMNLALLGSTLRSKRSKVSRITPAAGAVLGLAALDFLTGRQMRRAVLAEEPRLVALTKAITVNRPADEAYRFWRNFQNLARFMSHIESVEVQDERRSRWQARGPGDRTLEWDAEIIEDIPGQKIAWRSLPEADLPNAGEVQFRTAPGGRGTEIRWQVEYEPPHRGFGAPVAKLFVKTLQAKMLTDLRRCKQILELGEVVHSDASLAPGKHPARPTGKRGVR